jgi:eukaryotic-like serine/threonine-protein kinase
VMPAIAVDDDGVRLEARPPVLAIGQVLGNRFEIGAPIGKGGMGEVYRARDRQLGRSVAVKVLAIANDERRKRFAQEARATSALQHPNILTVYDMGEHDGEAYLVLELLEGETLRERLAGRALPPATVLELAIQIAGGLAAAHGAGIVHRDLKPENLLISNDPSTSIDRIKILDFGLAKLTRERATPPQSSLTVPGAIFGTVSYMSPEQLRGEDVDHRSDLFAFGTIVVEMLTGKAAFGGGSSAEVVSAILRDDIACESLPFSRVIRRCLDKRPERRFQSTQDLVLALESLRGTDPGESRRRHRLRRCLHRRGDLKSSRRARGSSV